MHNDQCLDLAPTCTDGIRNQDETDVDCGGSRCPACKLGKKCETKDDCDDSECRASFCQSMYTDSFR